MPTSTSGSLKALREGNRQRLLSLLAEHGALHRAELARRAGLSRSTVSTIATALLAEGLVVEEQGSSRGQEAVDGRAGGFLALNPSAGVAVGIDFSYREARAVVADLVHTILAEQTANLPPDQGWAENLELAATLANGVMAEAGAGNDRVLGVGLGVPGPIDQTRREVGFSSNSLGWVGAHAADELAAQLGVPVALDNTAHLGCLAEAVWGAGAGCGDLVYLKLGFGVGSGIVIGGRLHRGVIGAAGEIGHLTVDERGPACRCGNRGCLEVYAGIPALLAALRPVLGDDVTVPQVLTAAGNGHRAARRVLADIGQVVGRAMAGVCNLLNPGRIVVGGDLAAAGDLLLEPLRETLRRHALGIAADSVQVVPAELGDQAGALGGVALVFRDGTPMAGPVGGA